MALTEFLPYLASIITGGLGFAAAKMTKPRSDAEASKATAEASKIKAEAADIIVTRLYKHIDRIDAELEEMRSRFAKLAKDSAAEKQVLERENKQLRSKVARLETRVSGLESIFKTHPISPEMQAELDKLDAVK